MQSNNSAQSVASEWPAVLPQSEVRSTDMSLASPAQSTPPIPPRPIDAPVKRGDQHASKQTNPGDAAPPIQTLRNPIIDSYRNRQARRVPDGSDIAALLDAPLALPANSVTTSSLGPRPPQGDFGISLRADEFFNAYFRIISTADWRVCMPAFVPRGGSAQLRLPAGKYRILVAQGHEWYGWHLDFGRNAQYFRIVPNVQLGNGPEEIQRLDIQLGTRMPPPFRLERTTRDLFD